MLVALPVVKLSSCELFVEVMKLVLEFLGLSLFIDTYV
jgi:hypothetical protein